MAKDEGTPVKLRETRGGYPSGDKLISDLKPPPPGPAPGCESKALQRRLWQGRLGRKPLRDEEALTVST